MTLIDQVCYSRLTKCFKSVEVAATGTPSLSKSSFGLPVQTALDSTGEVEDPANFLQPN